MSKAVEQYDEMARVGELFLKTGGNVPAIVKELGITRARVLDHIDSWRRFVEDDVDVRKRARETLQLVDEHYGLIIKELWDTYNLSVKDADKINALKALAAIEKDRHAAFAAAGLNDDREIAEQMAETERKQEVLAGILRDVSSKCNHCRIEVRQRLAEYNGQPEVIEHSEVGA